MAKAAFKKKKKKEEEEEEKEKEEKEEEEEEEKKKNLFTSKLDFNLRNKMVKCYTWSIAFCGAETWTLRKADKKCLERFEMWRCKRMDQLDRLCEKWSVTENHGGEEYPT